MPDFSIIIPNWNGQKFLSVCFQSIAAQKTKASIETILVDNNSKDNSIAFTKEHFPWVKIIALDRNTGFDGAVNTGIKSATAPLISILNNDTELDLLWVESFIQAAQNHPEVHSFASKMLSFYDHQIIDTCGDALTWSGRSYKMGEGEKDGPAFNTEKLVFGACAGASVYRREFFDKVGLFDETFFAYLEDVDISFRAQLAGLRCLFVPEARVYHMVSATSGKGSAFGFKMMIKNHFHLIFKNYSLGQLLKHSPKLLYSEVRLFAAALKYKFLTPYLQGTFQALKENPQMWKKRAEIQKLRTVDEAYLNSIIEPGFAYKSLKKALRG